MDRPIELQGDEARLFEHYHVRLRRIVRGQVWAPVAVVDDACANAWLILIKCQPRRDTVWPWLKTVAIREARRLAAVERRELSYDEVDAYEPSAPTGVEVIAEFYEELARLEREVTPRQRRLVSLQAAGYRYHEIAAITGDSVRTVERQLRRARCALRKSAGPSR